MVLVGVHNRIALKGIVVVFVLLELVDRVTSGCGRLMLYSSLLPDTIGSFQGWVSLLLLSWVFAPVGQGGSPLPFIGLPSSTVCQLQPLVLVLVLLVGCT